MADQPDKPKDPLDEALDEIAGLKAKVSILETEIKSRDRMIDELRGVPKKPKLVKLDPDAKSAFERPYGGG